MTELWIELAGWVVAQAIEDACGGDSATFGQRMSAYRFLKKDPLVDHILDCFDGGVLSENKREYVLRVVIPERLKEKKERQHLQEQRKQPQ